MKKKVFGLLICLVLLILALNPIIAENGDEEKEIKYDYNDKNNYWEKDFYKKSDPKQWNWEYVKQNWFLVDFSRDELYDLDDFYASLDVQEYEDLDYNKVNFNNPFFDHKKVSSRKYAKDKCKTCDIQRFHIAGKVTFSDKGITHPNGDFVSIPGDYPPQSIFRIVKHGIEIQLPKETTEIPFPPQGDDVTVFTKFYEIAEQTDSGTTYTTSERKLMYKGNTIQGHISFKDGKPYVKQIEYEKQPIVNGIQIFALDTKVFLYFDDEEPEEDQDYIVMDKENRRLEMFAQRDEQEKEYDLRDRAFKIQVNQENPFLDIKENTGINISLYPGTKVNIEKREGATPLMKVVSDPRKNLNLEIMNGVAIYNVKYSSDFSHTGTLLLSDGETRESIPLTLFLQDEDGDNILGTSEEPQKIIFDEETQHVIVDEDLPLDVYECEDETCKFDLTRSWVLMQASEKQIWELLENIQSIESDEHGLNAVDMNRIANALEKFPPRIRASMRRLYFTSIEEVKRLCYKKNAGGCASDDGRIILPKHFNQGTFYHEGGHTRTFVIEKREKIEAVREQDAVELEIRRKHDGVGMVIVYEHPGGGQSRSPCAECTVLKIHSYGPKSPEDEQRLREVGERAIQRLKNGFEYRWKQIAGDVYGKDLAPLEPDEDLQTKWSDGESGPRKGVIRAYGANNYMEDVATFLEPIARKEFGFFKPLMAKDERYRKKLALLHEYEFISDEDYEAVIGA